MLIIYNIYLSHNLHIPQINFFLNNKIVIKIKNNKIKEIYLLEEVAIKFNKILA